MAAPKKLDMTLDEESAAIVADALHAGSFERPEQVVRAALRTWKAAERRLGELRAAIEEGATSGPGIPAEDVFDELEDRYRRMMGKTA